MNNNKRATIYGKIPYYTYWITILILFGIGITSIVTNLYISFKNNSLAFTIDAAYLHMNTSFPSITVCEIFNGEKNWDLNEKYYGDNRDTRIDYFTTDIAFFTGSCYTCGLCGKSMECTTNFTDIVNKYRGTCKELLDECSWNNRKFDCCKAFLPISTEYGICYTINSIHTKPKYGKRLISNRYSGPGVLNFVAKEDIQIHIHSPLDVPSIVSEPMLKETIFWGSTKWILFSLIEIVNDENVQEVSINKRGCRFLSELFNEKNVKLYNIYSYSACTVECHFKAQIELCNCTHHLMPRNLFEKYTICNILGLKCISDNLAKIVEHRRQCNCLISCDETEYNIIYSSPEEITESTNTKVKIEMMNLPYQRYIRNTVKNNLDYLISFGSIAALFSGASILSVSEVFYKMYKGIRKYYGRMDKIKNLSKT